MRLLQSEHSKYAWQIVMFSVSPSFTYPDIGLDKTVIMTMQHKLTFLLYLTIKSDMKTAQKIVNNWINENKYPLKVSSLRQDW